MNTTYYWETLTRVRLKGQAEKYYYHLKEYESPKDILGGDINFRVLTKSQYQKAKKQKKFKITEMVKPSRSKKMWGGKITNIHSKTEYRREFKRYSNRVDLTKI